MRLAPRVIHSPVLRLRPEQLPWEPKRPRPPRHHRLSVVQKCCPQATPDERRATCVTKPVPQVQRIPPITPGARMRRASRVTKCRRQAANHISIIFTCRYFVPIGSSSRSDSDAAVNISVMEGDERLSASMCYAERRSYFSMLTHRRHCLCQ